MTTLGNTFEGITPSGTTLTQGSGGNTAGSSGNFFDVIQISATAAVISDSTHAAHGGLACKVSTGGTAGGASAGWSASLTGTSVLTVWFRAYYFFTANPAVDHRIWDAEESTGTSGSIWVSSTGKVLAKNTAGSTLLTSANTIPLNQWFRVEGFVTGDTSVGQIEFRLFLNGPDAWVPTEVDTTTAAQNTGGPNIRVRFGISGTAIANVGPYWIDDVAVSDQGYIGPYLVPFSAPAAPGRTWLRQFRHHQQVPATTPSVANALSLSATATASGSQSVQVGPNLTTTATATGSQSVQAGKQLAGTATASGTLTRQVGRILSGTASAAGALARQVGKVLPGTTTAAGHQSVQVGKQIPATVTASGSVTRAIAKALAGTATATGTVTRGIGRTLTTSATAAGAILRGIGKFLAGAASAVGSLTLPPPPVHVPRAQVTITAAGPLAATVAVTANSGPGAALTRPGSPAVPGLAVPGLFVPGLIPPPLSVPAAEVLITAAGAGAASVTIAQPS